MPKIELKDCKPGYLYRIHARNIRLGVFTENANGPRAGFIGIREKFGHRYVETELHRDVDQHFGTARPTEELIQCPLEDIRVDLGTICGKCDDDFDIHIPVEYLPYTDGPRTHTYTVGGKEFTNTYTSGWQHIADGGKCTNPHGRRLGNQTLRLWLEEMEKEYAE